MPEGHFSLFSMFMNADITVKIVMILLLASSVWCWGIIFSKYRDLKQILRSTARFENLFWTDKSIKQIYDQLTEDQVNPMSNVFLTAIDEYVRLKKIYKGPELESRLDRVMAITANCEIEDLQSHTTFLATVGSTAPFIGLFGTVWGIMHSFQGIAAMQSTNLAVVAPGIAEALLATALGLVAAIPAVIGYNKISTEIERYNVRLDSFIQELGSRLSYQQQQQKDMKKAS